MKKHILVFFTLFGLLLSACSSQEEEPGSVTADLDPDNEGAEFLEDLPANAEQSDYLPRYYVENAEEREAVCNDGSVPTYYYREGSEENNDKWMVHLKGGGSCTSVETCKDRYKSQKSLMTSNGDSQYFNGVGFFSNDPKANPDFHDYNHVYLRYCSSDLWHGDAVVDLGGQEMQVRGWNIVEAVVEDLEIEDPTEIILSGSSAGGSGVTHNVDRFADWFPDARVTGVVDSAWSAAEIEPYDTSKAQKELPTLESTLETAELFNYQYDESCIEDTGGGQYCLGIKSLLEHIDSPLFYYVAQQDGNRLKKKLGITNFNNPDQAAYVDEYAAAVRESLDVLEAVFSPISRVHTSLMSARYNNVLIEGKSFQEVLGDWYFDRSDDVRVIEQP